MRRRAFLSILVGAAFVYATATSPGATGAQAQQAKRIWRIGYLETGSSAPVAYATAMFDAFRQGMRERGFMEGRDFTIEVRSADGKIERFRPLARELVDLKVDLIVATNSLAARGALQATATIPIVVPVMGDPVGDGLVASLARPGGNVTGLAFLGPELLPKRIALLKEALPAASRVAALWHPNAYGARTMGEMMEAATGAAAALGLALKLYPVQDATGIDDAVAAIAREHPDALIVYPSPMLFAEYRRIAGLAVRHRLPLIAMGREFAEAGGLIAYGASIGALHRQVAAHVERIMKGAKPAELPVEQASQFELVINLNTARLLGIDLPDSLLTRADEVVE